MKASELRIGNLVILSVAGIKHYGKIHTLTPTHLRIGDGIKCDYTDLEPIRLTRDLLIKCKFTNRSLEGTSNIFDIYYEAENLSNNTKIEKTFTICMFDDFSVAVQCNHFHFRYLHQLQNVYFSLTGEELEVAP